MAKFCKYCGKELIDGQCDCVKFQESRKTAVASPVVQPSASPVVQPSASPVIQPPVSPVAQPAVSPVQNQPMQPALDSVQQPEQVKTIRRKKKPPVMIPSFKVDTGSVSAFLTSIRDMTGMSREPDTEDVYEHNVPIVPDCIDPLEGEVIVRQYNIAKLCSKLRLMWAEGRLMVSNRRVVFRAAGTSVKGSVSQEQQFAIHEIEGIEMQQGYRFGFLNLLGALLMSVAAGGILFKLDSYIHSWGLIITGLLLGLGALVPTFLLYRRFWLKLLCSAMGTALIFRAYAVGGYGFMVIPLILALVVSLVNLEVLCLVPDLTLAIKTKGAQGAVVIGKSKAASWYGRRDGIFNSVEVAPGRDADAAMEEIGALLEDMKKLGDKAVEKWGIWEGPTEEEEEEYEEVQVALHAPFTGRNKAPASAAFMAKSPDGASAMSAANPPVGQLKTNRSLLKYILLGLITFHIYDIVVLSGVSTDINTIASRYDGKKTMHYCLVFFLLTGLTLGIVPLVWFTKLSSRVGAELKRRGIDYHISGSTYWLWNVLGSLILVGPFIYTHKLLKSMNLLAEHYNVYG